MARVTLEPVGRFAFLVVGVHAVIGVGLWWWLYHSKSELQGSAEQNLAWVSPADFSQALETSTAVQSTPQPTAPEPIVATAPAPETPPPAKPEPTVVVEAPAPAAKEEPADDNVPKAIAIDPAQAAALMARAMASAAAPPAPAPTPAPVPEPPKADPPKPEPKVEPKPEPKPTPEPVAKKPEPAPEPPPPPPVPQVNDVSRFVTVSHSAPPKVNKNLPRATTLLDVAALDESTTGAAGAATGIRLDEVDRAIIQGFLREWVAPDASKLSLDQRTVSLDVRIDRDGHVNHFSLPRHSGSDDLDLSVLEAANRLDKIEAKLPASYPRDSYEFQVNFHVE